MFKKMLCFVVLMSQVWASEKSYWPDPALSEPQKAFLGKLHELSGEFPEDVFMGLRPHEDKLSCETWEKLRPDLAIEFPSSIQAINIAASLNFFHEYQALNAQWTFQNYFGACQQLVSGQVVAFDPRALNSKPECVFMQGVGVKAGIILKGRLGELSPLNVVAQLAQEFGMEQKSTMETPLALHRLRLTTWGLVGYCGAQGLAFEKARLMVEEALAPHRVHVLKILEEPLLAKADDLLKGAVTLGETYAAVFRREMEEKASDGAPISHLYSQWERDLKGEVRPYHETYALWRLPSVDAFLSPSRDLEVAPHLRPRQEALRTVYLDLPHVLPAVGSGHEFNRVVGFFFENYLMRTAHANPGYKVMEDEAFKGVLYNWVKYRMLYKIWDVKYWMVKNKLLFDLRLAHQKDKGKDMSPEELREAELKLGDPTMAYYRKILALLTDYLRAQFFDDSLSEELLARIGREDVCEHVVSEAQMREGKLVHSFSLRDPSKEAPKFNISPLTHEMIIWASPVYFIGGVKFVQDQYMTHERDKTDPIQDAWRLVGYRFEPQGSLKMVRADFVNKARYFWDNDPT